MDAFGQALNQARDADLVDHLGQLAAADRAHQTDHAGIGVDDGAGLFEGCLIAADHDRQNAVLGTGLAAGHRRIEKTAALGGAGSCEFPGHFSGCRGVVDQDGAILDAVQNAVRAKRDRAQVVIIAHAGEDEIGALGSFRRCVAGGAAELLGPLVRLLRRAVVNPHFVAALGLEMPCHGVAHYAKSDEGNCCHFAYPFVTNALYG